MNKNVGSVLYFRNQENLGSVIYLGPKKWMRCAFSAKDKMSKLRKIASVGSVLYLEIQLEKCRQCALLKNARKCRHSALLENARKCRHSALLENARKCRHSVLLALAYAPARKRTPELKTHVGLHTKDFLEFTLITNFKQFLFDTKSNKKKKTK